MSLGKYRIMCLCKRGTTSLLAPLRWVDDYHVVFWMSTDNEFEANLTVLFNNIGSSKKGDHREVWWITEGDPHSKNLPEVVQKHIREVGIHVIY